MAGTHLCPWWMTWTFDNPLRRLVHDPDRVIGPFIRPGDLVADIGCGMGHFTTAMARAAGPTGRVLAIDLQAPQLAVVARRARRQGLQDRIQTRLATPDRLPLEPGMSFVLAFWMFHEVPGGDRFLAQVRDGLAPGGALLVVEPRMHVGQARFDEEVRQAVALGFVEESRPRIRFSRSVLLRRP